MKACWHPFALLAVGTGLLVVVGCAAQSDPNADAGDSAPGVLESALFRNLDVGGEQGTEDGSSGPTEPGVSVPDFSSPTTTGQLLNQTIAQIETRTGRSALIVDCRSRYGPYRSVQNAIDSAVEGRHAVVVLPSDVCAGGAHFGNTNFLGKAITVQSLFPDDPEVVEATILSTRQGRVVTFENGEGPEAVLHGLSVTGGRESGIYCESSDPTIRNCRVFGNSSKSDGGGLLLSQSQATISYCFIMDNDASRGAGVACLGGSHPEIVNCVITKNLAAAEGGAIYVQDSAPILRNCTISGNAAIREGGALSIDSSSPLVNSTIIWDNVALLGPGVSLAGDGSVLTVEYSIVQGGQQGIFTREGTLAWGSGNLEIDPMLEDDGFHLNQDSAARDAGDPAAVDEGVFDIDGAIRNAFDDQIDIGADEVEDDDA